MPDSKAAISAFCLLVASAALVLFTQCAHARAEAPPIPSTQLEPGKLIVVEGKRGQWWPLETAFVLTREHLEIRQMAELLLKTEDLNEVLNQRIEEKDLRLLNLQTIIDVTEERAKHAESAISHAEKVAADERARAEQAYAWYRHPVLWLVTGLLAGSGAAIAMLQ